MSVSGSREDTVTGTTRPSPRRAEATRISTAHLRLIDIAGAILNLPALAVREQREHLRPLAPVPADGDGSLDREHRGAPRHPTQRPSDGAASYLTYVALTSNSIRGQRRNSNPQSLQDDISLGASRVSDAMYAKSAQVCRIRSLAQLGVYLRREDLL